MAKRGVPVTYAFGKRDRVDPKLAPFGVLKVGKNLRVRKDGRLGVRNGYQPLAMTTVNGTLVANDLHEYKGRLCALGSDGLDGYPTDLFEYTGLSNEPWRGTDAARRVMLNPFTRLAEVAGLPQCEGGISILDAAAGGGYVCLAYVGDPIGTAYVIIVRQIDDQVIHQAVFLAGAVVSRLRVAYITGTFLVGYVESTNAITVKQFKPGTHSAFAAFATPSAASGSAVTAFDMTAVGHGSTRSLVVAFDRGGVNDLTVICFGPTGVQVGVTATVAGTSTVFVSVEADEVAGTINLFAIEPVDTGVLRTFDFAGSVLAGPTFTTNGTTGTLCRLGAQGALAESVAVAVNDASKNIVFKVYSTAAHAVSNTTTISQAVMTSRLVNAQSPNQPVAVALAGVVAPNIKTSFDDATNALFFLTPSVAHMTTRDLGKAISRGVLNLTKDAVTGKLCWATLKDPGDQALGVPAITILDFMSPARRQSARFGGLLYFAGGTPAVYDGRFPSELYFNELPGIVSLTPSNGAGALTPGATYTYVQHWEFVLADGSVQQSAPSAPVTITMGGADDTVAAILTSPHTMRIAAGSALYGADVISVLSRTVWDATAGIEGSEFRRTQTKQMAVGIAQYGSDLNITDTRSDADLGDEGVLYTQGTRGSLSGPLEHDAPQACSFITATESRLITGGLLSPSLVQCSKEAFLGEAIAFSEFSTFFSQVSAPVVGVHRLDGAKLVFTTDTIFNIPGEGPDDQGGGGLGSPVEIPTPSGLEDSRGILEAPDGLWFPLDDEKLFRMPRGGGVPEWEGVDAQDTLLAYPVITGACKSKRDNAAIFACENVASSDARLLVRDFRTQNWFEDTPVLGASQGIEAVATFGDSFAYVSSGVVYVQSTTSFADGTSTFITTQARTHPLYPFGLGGYGLISECLLTGEYRGACVLTARVSYDDGLSFTTLETFTLTGLTAGQTIQRKWSLPQDITSSVVFEVTVSVSSGATEGFVFNQLDLLVESEDGLRELDPLEMA